MVAELDLTSEARKYIQNMSVSDVEKQQRLARLDRFAQAGLPQAKQENWKYISWSQLPKKSYIPLLEGMTQLSKTSMAAGAFGLTSKDAVYYNPNEFYVWRSLNQEIQQQPPTTAHVSFKKEDFNSIEESCASLQSLFQALTNKVLKILVPADTKLQKPLLIHELFVNAVPTQQHQQMEIRLGKNSHAQIIYFDQSQGAEFFRQLKQVIVLEENATLDFVRVQNMGTQSTLIEDAELCTAQGSTLRHLTVALGAQIYRQNLHADIHHSGVQLETNGMALLTENQLADVCTQLRHLVGGSNTKQTFKSLLADRSKFNFNGMVFIEKGAKNANSEQLNKNILLSAKAEANSKPQLQIYSDDVKATHGSTTGQLDVEEIFYMQSRAIPQKKAVQMLSVGHVAELVYQVESTPVQEFVLDQLHHKLENVQLETV